jgi:ABC-2 type transport system ATP-binding protein
MAVISCFNVSKAYGANWAVRNMDLQVPSGSIFALIGPNGAGKSSTIKMFATLVEPTAGRILIDGFDVQLEPEKVRARIGYLPDHFTLYEDMSVERCLAFYGSCFGLASGWIQSRISELLELLDLTAKRSAPIKSLSRGMKQRVGIARALLHRPEVLLLDEPASGLDPTARTRLRHLLRRLRDEDQLTIVVSSHILTELGTFCDSLAIMQRGAMLEHGRVDAIRDRFGSHIPITLTVLEGVDLAVRRLRERHGVVNVDRNGSVLEFLFRSTPAAAADLLSDLVMAGVRVSGLERGTSDLEWIYAAISQGEVN